MSKVGKIKILDELTISGSKGKGRNPKIVLVSPEEDGHTTIMITPKNTIDIHKKNEKTGEYTPILCKSLKDVGEEINQFLLSSIQPANPSDSEYEESFALVFDECAKELSEKYKTDKKKVKISIEDVEKIALEKFSEVIPMNEVKRHDFKKALILDKNGKLIGVLLFENERYFFMKGEIIDGIGKILGFEN